MNIAAPLDLTCPVCQSPSHLHDVLDFNHIHASGPPGSPVLPLLGRPVYYALCPSCGFCFAPEFKQWTHADFAQHIYNEHYTLLDPGHVSSRPTENAATMQRTFANIGKQGSAVIRHLDYGGGSGLMSKLLGRAGWDSTSFEPFLQQDQSVAALGQFDLITVFEVFEHVPDVQQLMQNIKNLLAPHGMVLLTTLLSDGQIAPQERLNWWYATPVNGHISLFSKRSLERLAGRFGFQLKSFTPVYHALYTDVPAWATHLLDE
jgi:SAM-dependent methyltransferase